MLIFYNFFFAKSFFFFSFALTIAKTTKKRAITNTKII